MTDLLKTGLRFLSAAARIAALTLVAFMVWIQVPELTYDLSDSKPLEIAGPDDLDPSRITGTTFAVVRGKPDFSEAFIYRRYGLDHHYFTVEPYGHQLVVRTYDKITDEWRGLNSFVGRLRPFEKQPFSRYIRGIYKDRFDVDLPANAYFLALDDVPRLSGWQMGGFMLAILMWLGLFWLFFLWRRGSRVRPASPR